MKMPQRPPRFADLVQKLNSADRFTEVIESSSELEETRHYRHWDEIRYRPTPKNFTHEEWWIYLKFRRFANLKALPLLDKNQQAFKFGVPDMVLEQLHEIDRNAGCLASSADSITNPATRDQYVVRSLVEESITSSQLEGAVATREDAKRMLASGSKPRNKSERMILNNFLTMKKISEIRSQPLTPELLLEIQRRIGEDALEKSDAAGRLRRPDESVQVVDEMEGTVFHTPPPAEELPARIEAMCRFANGETPGYFVHPVVRAIILHFWLAYDHPFVDGNGRTARALFYWSMLHQGFWLFEFISISQFLVKAPVQYAKSFLHTETDDNDVTYFIVHQSRVIRQAIKELHQYIDRKTKQVQETAGLLQKVLGVNHRQRTVLIHALKHPLQIYTIAEHQHLQNVVYQTARTDLLTLAEMGLLDKRKSGKEWIFVPVSDLLKRLQQMRAPVAAVRSKEESRELFDLG